MLLVRFSLMTDFICKGYSFLGCVFSKMANTKNVFIL